MLTKIITHLFRIFASPETYARHIGVNIGTGGFISTKKFPTEPYLITIGNYVRIAKGTGFFTHGGVWSIRKKYNNPTLDNFGKISIGDYSYIGENCMIMAGVTIGKNCIIGGGSVVTRSVPDGIMVAGNPAKFIGYTEDFYNRLKSNTAMCCKEKTQSEKRIYLSTLSDDQFPHKKYIKVPDCLPS